MSLTEINVKNFILCVKNSQTYQLAIDGFSKTSNWFITVVLNIPIVASLLLQAKATVSLALHPIRINIDTMFLTTKMTLTINNSLLLNAIAKLTYKITTTINNTLLMSTVMKLTTKMTSTMNISTQLILTMLTGIFNPLSDYDAGTLATIDSETLGDLDFTTT